MALAIGLGAWTAINPLRAFGESNQRESVVPWLSRRSALTWPESMALVAILQLVLAVLFLLLGPVFLYAVVHAVMVSRSRLHAQPTNPLQRNEKADLWLRFFTVVPVLLVAACCIVLRFVGKHLIQRQCIHYFEHDADWGPNRELWLASSVEPS